MATKRVAKKTKPFIICHSPVLAGYYLYKAAHDYEIGSQYAPAAGTHLIEAIEFITKNHL